MPEFFPLPVGALVRCNAVHAFLYTSAERFGQLRAVVGRLPIGGTAIVLEAFNMTCRVMCSATGTVGWTFSDNVAVVS